MAKKTLIVAAWILLSVATGVGGLLFGRGLGFSDVVKRMQQEAAGNLSQRIEVLSMLQMGNVTSAITQLEREADLLTTGIASNPGANTRVLAYVKTYLSAAPPSPSRATALSAALAGVSVLEPSNCKTALRTLLESKKKGSGVPSRRP